MVRDFDTSEWWARKVVREPTNDPKIVMPRWKIGAAAHTWRFAE